MLYSEVFTLSDKQKDAVSFIRSSFGDYPPLMATNQGKADQWSVGSIALMLSCLFTRLVQSLQSCGESTLKCNKSDKLQIGSARSQNISLLHGCHSYMLHTHSHTARGVKVKNNILFRASYVSMCDKTPSPAAPVSLSRAKRPKQTSISSGESDALSSEMLLPSGRAECPMRQTVIAEMEIEMIQSSAT